MPELIDTQQQPLVETTAALGADATFTSPARDCLTFRRFGVSVFAQRGGANTNVTIVVENSDDGVTFRTVQSMNFIVNPAGPTVTFNNTYDATRRFMRVRVSNNTANALAATEVSVMRKPF